MERIQKYINRIYRASIIDRGSKFKDIGLSGFQVSYILYVVRKPGLTQDEMSRSIYVNKSSVARQVTRLIDLGFISREVDPKDNRRKLLYPTELAHTAYEKIMEYLEDWNHVLLDDFTEDEQDTIAKFLRRIAISASEEVSQSLDELE